MKYTVNQKDGCQVVLLEGEIDMNCSPELRQALQNLLKQKAKKICVDLSKVSYMDSSGIATLIEAHQRLSQIQGELRLASVPPAIFSVLEMTRLDRYFKIYPSVASSLKS